MSKFRRVPAATDKPTTPSTAATAPAEGVRVSKLMAERGLCSRREADSYIERGLVFVNGEQITVLGTRAAPDAVITMGAEARVQQAKYVTILLHKPMGYVSGQAEDGHRPASTLIAAASQVASDDLRRHSCAALLPPGVWILIRRACWY
jgi:23S rRNA pseudouridine2604 synthase